MNEAQHLYYVKQGGEFARFKFRKIKKSLKTFRNKNREVIIPSQGRRKSQAQNRRDVTVFGVPHFVKIEQTSKDFLVTQFTIPKNVLIF